LAATSPTLPQLPEHYASISTSVNRTTVSQPTAHRTSVSSSSTSSVLQPTLQQSPPTPSIQPTRSVQPSAQQNDGQAAFRHMIGLQERAAEHGIEPNSLECKC